MTAAVPEPTLEGKIAEVLGEHARWAHGTGEDGFPTHQCRCGVDLPHGRNERIAPLHRTHLAAVLAPLVAEVREGAVEEALEAAAMDLPGWNNGIRTHGDAARWLRHRATAARGVQRGQR